MNINFMILLKEIKPVEDWIQPGVAVTSVEKKINKPDHPRTEVMESNSTSDDDNDEDKEDSDSDDDEKDNDVQITENNDKFMGPSEIDETDNVSMQKMDVDDSVPQENNEIMEED